MESDSWSRISNYSRRYRSRSDVYHEEEYEGEEEQQSSEFLCPFCSENFDVVGLCCHIDEEHAFEAKNGVCPICAKRVGSDLVRHLTVQHGSLLKVQRRRRLRKGVSNFPLSLFKREFRDGSLHSLLGGSSLPVTSSHIEPDPLLTSFIYNPPDADESSSVQPLSSVEECSMVNNTGKDSGDRVAQKCPLSDEDLREKTRRCEFAQGLVMSTFLDDL